MIQIFTDSSANLPQTLIDQYQIKVVSFHYSINGEEFVAYETGKAFDGKTFYDCMRDDKTVKTSMINIAEFISAFSESLEKGDDIIYIGMSSGVSGAFQSAKAAYEEIREEYPDRKIAIIDSLAASMGEGLQVIEAAKNSLAGLSFDEIVGEAKKEVPLIRQFFTVDNLKYLARGGRISAAVARIGSVLNIKPILCGDKNGKIFLYSKIRGRMKSIDELARLFIEQVKDLKKPIAIAHADCKEAAEHLADRLRKLGQKAEIIITTYEPVSGAHVGPGALALFFQGKEAKT